MNTDPRSTRAARYLFDEHRAGRAFTPVPADFAPRDVAEAFAAQAAFQQLMGEVAGEVAGWKVALTTPVMQQMVGFDEPVPGTVFGNTVHASGAQVAAAGFNHLGIECELALRLAQPLRAADAPHTPASVIPAVGAVMAAFELVDDRSVDYSQFAANVLSFIADNAWNGGAVLGDPLTDWQGLERSGITGVLEVNGEEVDRGQGRDVMGDPLNALVWLANSLSGRGLDLQAGMLVMTGSIIATRFAAPGDTFRFRLGELAPVSVRIT
jgi:2-oxo-3-hexenedioate decarboxylase/2-keto-4-pentenoate hydratase